MKCETCGYEQEDDFRPYIIKLPLIIDNKPYFFKYNGLFVCPNCGKIKVSEELKSKQHCIFERRVKIV